MHARCNVPPLSRVGNLNVSVSSDNGVTFRYQGNFLVGMYRALFNGGSPCHLSAAN